MRRGIQGSVPRRFGRIQADKRQARPPDGRQSDTDHRKHHKIGARHRKGMGERPADIEMGFDEAHKRRGKARGRRVHPAAEGKGHPRGAGGSARASSFRAERGEVRRRERNPRVNRGDGDTGRRI